MSPPRQERRAGSSRPSDSASAHIDHQFTDTTVDEVIDRVRSLGGRATVARRLILTLLFSDPKHRTAEEIATAVQTQAPEVHLSTIYRNLEELERIGVVEHVHLGHGPATYHVAPSTHGHLVCQECGAVTEIDDDSFGPFVESIRDNHGFTVDLHHFALLGRCARCASKSEAV
jgi:Fur family transcriptional regulator, ferric uptake regulator